MDQRGVSIVFKEGLLSHSTEELRRGTVLCATILSVEDFYAQVGYVTILLSKFFLSRRTVNLGRLIFLRCVSANFRQRKVYRSEGSIKIFQRRFVVSH